MPIFQKDISYRERFSIYIAFQFFLIIVNFLFYKYPQNGVYFYYTILLTPLIELFLFGFVFKNGNSVLKSFKSIYGFILFLSVLVFWAYAIFVVEVNISLTEITYLMEIIYFPVFVEQFNFSVIGVEIGSALLRRGTAAFLSVIFYGLYYFVILINDARGFPGIYFWFFILDSVGVGVIYIFLYTVSKTIWVSMSLEISLLMSVIFIPPLPAAFFYTFVPS
ncbi:hypothetical protein ACNF40_06785 [Cuniculiplasma sp. SKW4]|uniref:hypothetical protein n=1 Tax=Cuniculiplasma sp. SKW4 TaxID=3400171 RepID=UPI003FD1E0FD